MFTTQDGTQMTSEEIISRQIYLHQQIQQQMEMQMQMSKELERKSLISNPIPSKPAPYIEDDVFDMLDDLIMIPSGGIAATEKNSFSLKEEFLASDEGGCRDSLADIMESLDMDLEDFETNIGHSSGRKNFDPSMMDEARDSFNEQTATEDLNELNMDFDIDLGDSDPDDDNDLVDHGIDDDDDDVEAANRAFLASSDPDEPAVNSHVMPRRRLSSADMLASVASISSGRGEHGNLCTLIWEDGLLGLRLRMSQSRMLPAVSKITGRSSIFGIHLVDVGDLLIQIGSKATGEMEFIEAINYLKEVEKPCKLVFRRVNSDPMAVKPVQPKVISSIATKLAEKFDELMKAENEKGVPLPSVKFDARYEIKWNDGPLGISLIASKDVPFPLVTRITGKNRSPQVQDVQPGHYLVQIGTYNTADGNFNATIKYLQRVIKPVSLFFCPGNKKPSMRPELSDDEYDHIWEKKQALCFTVKADDNGRIVVADLGNAKSIKLKARGPNLTSNVESGDYIEWINEENTRDMTFHEALMKLRTAKRPLVVRFKKAPQIPILLTLMPHSKSAAVVQQQVPPPAAAPVPEPEPVKESVRASRSFNPLKKIAAYSKENSINASNMRSNDKKSKDPVSELPAAAPTPTKSLQSSKSLPQNSTSHVQPPAPVTLVPSGINLESVSANPQPQKSLGLLKASSDPTIFEQNLPSAPLTAPIPRKSSGASAHELDKTRTSRGAVDTLEEYEVVWPEGTALGLTLRVHPITRFPVVARVTGTSNLKNIEHVTPGDILFAANNMPIVPQPKFKQTLENLSKLPKPALLRFRRASPLEQMQQMQVQQSVVHRSHPPAAAAFIAQPVEQQLLARGPPLLENEYELIWREYANLGLVFSSENEIPKVTKVDIESGGPVLSKVSNGDTLTWIGSINIDTMNFQTSMATLRAVKRPVVLRFQMRGYGADNSDH